MNVTFCGHSKLYQTENISKWLDIILPALIEGGATTFYLGGYGDFDSLAAAAVRRQKTKYPNIEAVLVLAYLNREMDASRYDGTTYPPLETVPPRYAIVRRNEWMVRESDVVISGVTHGWGAGPVVGWGGENSGLRKTAGKGDRAISDTAGRNIIAPPHPCKIRQAALCLEQIKR